MTDRNSRRESQPNAPVERRERLYTDKEVGDLIKLATERQEDAEALSRRGLPLSEIERIASEVGIDPRHLRAAALELDERKSSDRGSVLTGGPFVMSQKRVVEGALSVTDWEEIVPELRLRLGGTGRTGQIGQTQEWTRQVKDLDLVLSETQVRIRPDVDQTTIDIRKHYGGGATVAYLAGFVLSGSAAAVFLNGAGETQLVNTLVLGASSLGGLAVARASIAAWSHRQRQKLRSVINWLEGRTAATRPPPSVSPFEFPNNYESLSPLSPLPASGSPLQESVE